MTQKLETKTVDNDVRGVSRRRTMMKITQYNARIQYWYDRSVRTWFCATNNLVGAVTCTAIDSYTKKDCLENCQELEDEIQTASSDFDSKNFSERKWEHETYEQ